MRKPVERRVLSRLTIYLGKKLVNNMPLFYILNFTWGIFENVVGAVLCILLFFFSSNSAPFGAPLLELKNEPKSGEGGFTLGIFTFVTHGCGIYTKAHGFGHSVQNAIYGPFFIFFILFSVLLNIFTRSDFDDVWFQYSATKIGEYAVDEQ